MSHVYVDTSVLCRHSLIATNQTETLNPSIILSHQPSTATSKRATMWIIACVTVFISQPVRCYSCVFCTVGQYCLKLHPFSQLTWNPAARGNREVEAVTQKKQADLP